MYQGIRRRTVALLTALLMFYPALSNGVAITITPPDGLVVDGQAIDGGTFTLFGLLNQDPRVNGDAEFLCATCEMGNFPTHQADFSNPQQHTLIEFDDPGLPVYTLLYQFAPDDPGIDPFNMVVTTTDINNLTIILPTTVNLPTIQLQDPTMTGGFLDFRFQTNGTNGEVAFGSAPPFITTVEVLDPVTAAGVIDSVPLPLGVNGLGEPLFAHFFNTGTLFAASAGQDHGTTNVIDPNDPGNTGGGNTGGGNTGGGNTGGGNTGGGNTGGGNTGGGNTGGGNTGGGNTGGGNTGGGGNPTVGVPEPATWLLLMAGLAALSLRRRNISSAR